ncbi:beta-N-acetylhexosaminidase [Azospirillum sp. A29]|uniref:beta-N-acetylhexosaminidase n=1 Tax=Azospirillum sp. A29 TaxID=3160606 RepID=UPI00366E6248
MWGVWLSVPDSTSPDSVGHESVSSPQVSHPRAVVFGCAGLAVTADEAAFFRDADPLGFILFRRNCDSRDQMRRLVDDLRASVGRADAPVLIDQEGGRVARMRPPHWPAHPPMGAIGALGERDAAAGREAAREAAWINGRLLAHMLTEVGITVDCAPVCDVPVEGAHDIIGDRAFSRDPALVIDLARATADGLLAGGVLPVIKHIPGHGRAFTDSHAELPVVEVDRAALEATDFAPFRALADLPLAMVAHVVLKAIDPTAPASTSAIVVREVVRGASIGFGGLLFSDDLSMNALRGDPRTRAEAVLAAGMDVVLHCNGDLAEMRSILGAVPLLSGVAAERWARAEAMRHAPEAADIAALTNRLAELLGTAQT